MDNLFSEDPQFRRAQWTKLSDNTNEWPQEISAMITEHLPRDLGLTAGVVFQKIEPEKGYALGTAIVRQEQSERQVGVPVIVKAWHVAPFDMFFQAERTFPLNPITLSRVFNSVSIGSGLASKVPPPQMQDDSLADVRYAPMAGKYASVRDAVSGTCRMEDLDAFDEAVRSQPGVMAKYAKKGMMGVLLKWAAEKPAEEAPERRRLRALTVKKDGINEYRLYAAGDGVYEPMLMHGDRREVAHLLSHQRAHFGHADPMSVVDKNGEITLTAKPSPLGRDLETQPDGPALGERKRTFVFDPHEFDRSADVVDKFGAYAVRDKAGILARGWVFPVVINFDGSKTGLKIFSGGLSAIQNRIVGIPLHDTTNLKLVHTCPDIGKTGVYVFHDEDKAVATTPFEVTAVTICNGVRHVHARDMRGAEFTIVPSASIDGVASIGEARALGPAAGKGKAYLISAKALFVPLERLSPVSESPEDFRKVASDHTFDPAPLRITRSNNRYIAQGARLAKYAAAPGLPFHSLERHEAAFLLGSLGLGSDKIASVFEQLRLSPRLEVHHLDYPPPPVMTEKTASPLRQRIEAMRPDVRELVKAAAMLEDADSVDSVLALHFVNEENIGRFVAVRPMLEELASILTKLLLAARLGMEDIPEEALRSCVLHLQRVIEGLNKLTLRGQQEKISASA